MVSRITDAWCAHWRSCQPATIPGLDAPSAMSTLLPVREATEDAPQRVELGFTGRQRDVERLLVGPVKPERQGDFDTPGHSIATSTGWSSRIRPGSSRDASLT